MLDLRNQSIRRLSYLLYYLPIITPKSHPMKKAGFHLVLLLFLGELLVQQLERDMW
jgi:hypothetical protein